MWLEILKACVPIAVALVGIIPTVISNRKKTQESLEQFKAEIKGQNEAMHEEVSEIKANLAAHIRENEDNTAESWRVRILSFDDGLCNENIPYPSEANFMQAVSDCQKYSEYISNHPDFKNGIGQAAIEHIIDTWKVCKHDNLFLKLK